MKISIVTPCFNYLKYLPDAVDSVRSQVDGKTATGQPVISDLQVEHIIIDAASTDGTIEWLERYSQELRDATEGGTYTFSYVSEPDKGQTDAINKGLRLASGDVVCWLNADEYYLPGTLKKVADAFEHHPDKDLIHGEALYVDSDKNPIRIKRDHRFDKTILLYYGCYIQSCSTFWRRTILDEGHYLDDAYKVTMDFEYWVRLMRLGYSFLFIPEVIAAFMWHDENVSEVYAERRKQERVQVQRKYGLPFMNYPLSQLLFRVMQMKHRWMIIQRKITNDFRTYLPYDSCK